MGDSGGCLVMVDWFDLFVVELGVLFGAEE
jgi:hypothetical protein